MTPGDGLQPLYHLATGRPMEPDVIRLALGEPVSYRVPIRDGRQVYLETGTGILEDVRVSYGGAAEIVWAAEGEAWPAISAGTAADPPELRAVLVPKMRGDQVRPFAQSDDRVVTFLVDARSGQELDEIEAAVRASSGGPDRVAARSAHREALTALHDKGLIAMAGPLAVRVRRIREWNPFLR